MPLMAKPYCRRQLTREENSKLEDLQRQAGGSWRMHLNINEQIQGATGHNGAKAEVCQRLCIDMCDRQLAAVGEPLP